jgi:splicing factor 3B subunit 1
MMGCAVLPHLKAMVDIIKHGLKDENQKVKTITALSLAGKHNCRVNCCAGNHAPPHTSPAAFGPAALAESAAPYGIESFDDVLEPLWRNIRSLRGKVKPCLGGLAAWAQAAPPHAVTCLLWPQVLASFLKCIGYIIPLMDAEHAFYYTREVRCTAQHSQVLACQHLQHARSMCTRSALHVLQVMVVLKREFATPDEEMKKIVLKVSLTMAPWWPQVFVFKEEPVVQGSRGHGACARAVVLRTGRPGRLRSPPEASSSWHRGLAWPGKAGAPPACAACACRWSSSA